MLRVLRFNSFICNLFFSFDIVWLMDETFICSCLAAAVKELNLIILVNIDMRFSRFIIYFDLKVI